MNRSDIIAKQKEFLFPSVATFYKNPLPLARGEGQYVWDVEGKRYLERTTICSLDMFFRTHTDSNTHYARGQCLDQLPG